MYFNYRVMPDTVTVNYEDVFDRSVSDNVDLFVSSKEDVISGVEGLLATVDEEKMKFTDIPSEVIYKLHSDFNGIFKGKPIHVDLERLIVEYDHGFVPAGEYSFHSDMKAQYREIMDTVISNMKNFYLLSNRDHFNRIKGTISRFKNATAKADSIEEWEVLELAEDIIDYCRLGVISYCIKELSGKMENDEPSKFMRNFVDHNSFLI